MKRGIIGSIAVGIAAVDLLPLWIILKQAVTPERESVAWPPTWLPQHLTLENFAAVSATDELRMGMGLSILVALLAVILTLLLTLPAAWVAARRRRLNRPLDAAIVVTRLFPSMAVAVPLAALCVRLGLYNHPAGVGLWLAHTLLAVPFAFLTLRTAFRAVP